MTANEVQQLLSDLHSERSLAVLEGLGEQRAYMAELDEEIATWRAAYVGAAVTEIATLRAELSGPQVG